MVNPIMEFAELKLTFGEALKRKIDYDTEAKKRKSKSRAVITRSEWISEDASYARVTVHRTGEIKVSRVRKTRGKNYLTVEDYSANDWQMRF